MLHTTKSFQHFKDINTTIVPNPDCFVFLLLTYQRIGSIWKPSIQPYKSKARKHLQQLKSPPSGNHFITKLITQFVDLFYLEFRNQGPTVLVCIYVHNLRFSGARNVNIPRPPFIGSTPHSRGNKIHPQSDTSLDNGSFCT